MTKAITNDSLDQKLNYAIEKIGGVDKKVDDVVDQLDKNYITKDYFEMRIAPLDQSKRIVFAFIGVILTAFASTIVYFFINEPK